ncbi:IS630 family transposase [Dactylosporangium fulvum]|uniref:IS630 family transposase n=1 Tax=Dactylosporangium fulvum TaxID=53359 RepID=A0ABY5WBM3_9ACTN|nr:IS630 family transposase [Dactylosporangium fulvum]UWP86521.1 IS630 family transposase [Dactylosporangium fulvum]
MPKLLYARPPMDVEEERKVRKLAGARHAPADWIMRAKMIAASWGGKRRSAVRLKRAAVVELYTHPPACTTVICADELGPVIARTFPPAPGWSPDGHRIKAPLEYSRGTDKLWVYGALRIRDGAEVTCCAPSRNSDGWIQLLAQVAGANRRGQIRVVTDNLSSHFSAKVRCWLARHPRIQQVFIPKRACWLNMAEGWWRLLRRAAFAGQSFVDTAEIAYAVEMATTQLNTNANPGCEDDRHHPPAPSAASSCTAFEERRTRRQGPGKVVLGVRVEVVGVDAPLLEVAGRA